MSIIIENMCRVCLKSSNYYEIRDSTCYFKFFIQVTGFKEFSGKLWLCTWCTKTLRRTIHFVELASKAEQAMYNESESSIRENINLYNLSYTHNPHIDIPSLNIIEQEVKETHNFTAKNIDLKIQESNDSRIQESNYTIIQEPYNSIHEKSIPIKISKRKKLNNDQLKFEMKQLNLEEQLNELELKKLKNKNNLNMKFMCDHCGTGFSTIDLLEAHQLKHTETAGQHKCTVCRLHFKSSDVLSQHILSHKRRFRCLICDAVFNRWSRCLIHRYKCGGGSTPARCGYCLRIFSDEHSLKVHIKGVHKKEKKYICEQCRVGFATRQGLTVHMRSHTGLKPFSCPQCPSAFTTNSNLRAHSAVHDDVTRYYCVECNTHYKSAKTLKRHFEHSARHMTENNSRYSCKVCPKRFPSEKSLNRHVEVRHNTTYRCEHCNKTFSNNTNLNKHIRCIHSSR